MNDDILLTREQIGMALEYVNPSKAIQKIHLSHKDRLKNLCIRIIENRVPQNGGIGVNVETIYYTQRGVMEICRFSRQTKANQFMDWVWDIIEKYRNRELSVTSQMNIAPITEAITSMSQAITTTNYQYSSNATRYSGSETVAKKPLPTREKISFSLVQENCT